jgi:hypothetical protein
VLDGGLLQGCWRRGLLERQNGCSLQAQTLDSTASGLEEGTQIRRERLGMQCSCTGTCRCARGLGGTMQPLTHLASVAHVGTLAQQQLHTGCMAMAGRSNQRCPANLHTHTSMGCRWVGGRGYNQACSGMTTETQ